MATGNTEEQIKTRIQEALAAQAEKHRKESADKELLIIARFEGRLQQSLIRTCTAKITTEYNNSVLSNNSVVESSLSITTEISIVEKYGHLDSSLNEFLFKKYEWLKTTQYSTTDVQYTQQPLNLTSTGIEEQKLLIENDSRRELFEYGDEQEMFISPPKEAVSLSIDTSDNVVDDMNELLNSVSPLHISPLRSSDLVLSPVIFSS